MLAGGGTRSSTAVAGSALMVALRTAVVFLPAFLLGLIVFPQHVGGCRQKFFNFNRLEHYADALVGRFIRGFLGGISRKQRSGKCWNQSFAPQKSLQIPYAALPASNRTAPHQTAASPWLQSRPWRCRTPRLRIPAAQE